jgi:hypothetical protein
VPGAELSDTGAFAKLVEDFVTEPTASAFGVGRLPFHQDKFSDEWPIMTAADADDVAFVIAPTNPDMGTKSREHLGIGN